MDAPHTPHKEIYYSACRRGTDFVPSRDQRIMVASGPQSYGQIITYLLSQRVDPNTIDASGKSALMYAAGNPDGALIVDELLASHADVGVTDNDGRTALMYGSLSGNEKTVHTLLDNAADVHSVDCSGKCALMFAEGAGVAKILLHRLADPTAYDKFGATALMCARGSSKIEIGKAVLDLHHGSETSGLEEVGNIRSHCHHCLPRLLPLHQRLYSGWAGIGMYAAVDLHLEICWKHEAENEDANSVIRAALASACSQCENGLAINLPSRKFLQACDTDLILAHVYSKGLLGVAPLCE